MFVLFVNVCKQRFLIGSLMYKSRIMFVGEEDYHKMIECLQNFNILEPPSFLLLSLFSVLVWSVWKSYFPVQFVKNLSIELLK
jgi:hypothetical protein